MKCQSLSEAIVEVARGRTVGVGTAAAVDSHVEHCRACAAKLARERELTAGLRALAAATSGARPSAGMEVTLLQAFAGQHATVPTRTSVGRWWLQIAAAAVLAVGGFVWWRVPVAHTPAGTSGAVPLAAGKAEPAAVSGLQAPAVEPTVPTRPVAARRVVARDKATRSGVIRVEGFVMLPAALGLPDFESGEIVRMELPIASLPAYGIEIEPDARATPVEADLLVGQDGQARAIRLVTASSTEGKGR
jgi:hypothetical protein